MSQILLPIEGHAAHDEHHLAQAISLHRSEQSTVVLLSVQPAVSGHVAAFFDPAQLHAMQHDAGMEELAPAHALLEAAGVPHRQVVKVGRRATTIAGAAREYGCSRILLANEQGEGWNVFGSIPAQVRQLVERQASGAVSVI